jgi:hypothetical protein
VWIRVYNCNSGQSITNATFTVSTYNDGTGWYYMNIGYGQNFCVGAPGYGTVCGNTDSYSSMWASLCPYTPPSTYGNCWSG